MQLDQPDKENEEEEISVTIPCSARTIAAKFDQGIEHCIIRREKKEEQGIPNQRGPKRKRKLLTTASSAAKKAKVYIELLSILTK